MKTSEYLKSLRGIRGYDYVDMQRLLGIHRVTYKKYENNPLKINFDILLNINNVLGGTIDSLFYAIKQDQKSCMKEGE